MSRDYRAAGEAIEEQLASIPRKPVDRPRLPAERAARVPVGRCQGGDAAPALDVAAVVPSAGSYACHRCAAEVPWPGVCAACGEADARTAAAGEMRGAIQSLPAAYVEPSMPGRLHAICELEGGADPWASAQELALELVTEEARTVFIWGGRSGAGKSSLACAILRGVVALALEALIAWRPELPVSRLGPMPAEPRVIQLGRGARVVHELDLLTEPLLGPDAPPSVYAVALAAPLLVLDGMSGGGRFVEASTKLIEKRWLAARPTVATTPLSVDLDAPDDIGRVYNGSVRRRLCDDRAARVVRVM